MRIASRHNRGLRMIGVTVAAAAAMQGLAGPVAIAGAATIDRTVTVSGEAPLVAPAGCTGPDAGWCVVQQ